MSPDDLRLSAMLAAFVPERAGRLASLLGGSRAGEVRAAAEALVRGGRSARLAELARALMACDDGSAVHVASVVPVETGGRPRAGGGRVQDRLRLELRAARRC